MLLPWFYLAVRAVLVVLMYLSLSMHGPLRYCVVPIGTVVFFLLPWGDDTIPRRMGHKQKKDKKKKDKRVFFVYDGGMPQTFVGRVLRATRGTGGPVPALHLVTSHGRRIG